MVATSRWNRGKDLSWEPIKLGLVCEVSYDHLQGTRFRHATHFKRWRPDKPPAACIDRRWFTRLGSLAGSKARDSKALPALAPMLRKE